MTPGTVNRGLLFGVIAAFFWGTHSVLVQFLTGHFGGIEIAALRLFIAAAAIFMNAPIMLMEIVGAMFLVAGIYLTGRESGKETKSG